MRKVIFFVILSIILNSTAFSQGTNCASADPFCTGSTYTFPNNTGIPSAGGGNNYDCLGSTPNPAWYYMQVATNGSIDIGISQTNGSGSGIDVDFILYGPYSSYPNAMSNCGNMGNGNAANNGVVDCSYSAAATETANIPSAVAGQVYVLLLTNYADQAGTIQFSQTGGTGATNCTILVPCVITGLSATPGTCQVATNTYTVNGAITFHDAPITGTLTVTDCHGNTQVFNAPFTSPQAYSIAGITSNGVACNVTAVFSADPSCTKVTNYTAPSPCTCSITGLTAIKGACVPATNAYPLSGSITFTNAPATGTLTVTDCNGNNQVFNAPFTSPQAYSLSGLPSNGAACNVTAVFSATPTCTLTTNFTAQLPCTPSCSVTGITLNTTSCDGSGEYTTSGQISFVNPPATGNLVIEDCNGVQEVVSVAGLVSPYNYSLSNQTADGAACDITASFSADAACTQTLAYTAPGCSCNIDNFQAVQGFCDGLTNTFELTGSIEYSFPPATGTLTITANNGTNSYDTIINAPFTSPQTWSINGIPADGSNITITATFSNDAVCTATLNTVAPPDCTCPANIGTFTTVINGDGQNNYQLCFGDVLEITSNNNYTYPNEATAPPVPAPYGYNPGIGYLLYSCPPTIGTVPSSDTTQVITNDPCFLGVVSYGDDYDVVNNLGAVGAPFTNSTVYYVPITFYDTLNGLYSYTNTSITCFSMGTPFAVQYLDEIVSSSPTEDCVNGTFTITINGGLPALNGSNFTASNLLPATASFVNTTTTDGGTIQINGLLNGDMYSFDVADANGCPITITGGSFVGLPTANAGVDDTSCTLTYNLNAIPSIGTGAWTGPANISFTPNATTPNATATSTTAGTFDLYWTETNTPGCSTTDTVKITFLNPITTVVVADCQDSSITVTLSNGLPEQDGSNYTISNLLPATSSFTTSIATHAGDVVAQGLQDGDMYSFDIADNFGCATSITGGPFVGLPTANAGVDDTSCTLTYTLNATPSIGTGAWTGPANISFTPNATTPNATATSTTAGTYALTWTETNTPGCTDAASVNITFTQMSIPNVLTNISCNGGNDGQIVVAPQGGIAPYQYIWSTSSNLTPVENNLSAGNITITVKDNFGCTLDSTFTLTQPAAFGVTITSTTPVTCKSGNDGQATANVADVIATYTYSWNTTPIQNTATATNLIAGTYIVTATQAISGCTDTISVTITEPTVVTIATISNDTTICSGQSTTITATATGGSGSGYIYTWDNGLGAGQSQTVTPPQNTTTTYQVTAVDGNGCPSNMQDVTVTIHPDLSVIASVDDTICPTTSTTISATPNGGNGGPYNYSWTPNTNMTGTNTQSPTVTPTATTTYTVTLSDGCSPTVTDQVTITLWNLPQPLALTDTLSLCIEPRQAITFYNQTDTTNGMVDTTKVFWNFGDGIIVSQPWDTISHTYNQSGTYTVTMTVSSMISQGGCTVTQTVIPQIDIYALPIADFISTPNITSMFEPEVQFADQSGSTILSWYWDFAGLDSSNYPNPMYVFPDDTNGVYPEKLTVTDNHGCEDTITKTVTITGEYGIYIPNAFTPDFDNKNDMFGPKGFGILSESYHFMIFDRWGEKMFDTDTPFKPWDGFFKGNRVQEGVYVWKLFFRMLTIKNMS